jgi:hypothetical protein
MIELPTFPGNYLLNATRRGGSQKGLLRFTKGDKEMFKNISTALFGNMINKYHEKKSEILFLICFVLPIILLCIGWYATKSVYGEHSFWPHHIIVGLFSPTGRLIMLVGVVIAAALIGIACFRNLRYAGMDKDDRNFHYSDKGAYGTAKFMNHTQMLNKFHCVKEKNERPIQVIR